MKKYSVCIIGLGNIAQGYDNIDDDLVLTHIKSFKNNNAFEVLTVFDLDKNKSSEVSKKWNIPYISNSINEIMYHDVISICTPEPTHNNLLLECLKIQPKLVFCEKPISLDENKSRDIIKLYKEKNIFLCVNYSRRWINKIELLKKDIEINKFGNILSIRMKYYNDFLNNGSHFIDIINYMFEPSIKSGFILSETKYKQDRIITASCNLVSKDNNFTLMIEGYNGDILNPLELELIFEKSKIIIEEQNSMYIRSYSLKDNEIYKGYKEFIEIDNTKINPSEQLVSAVKNIEDILKNNVSSIKSNGDTALKTLELCNNILSLRKIS